MKNKNIFILILIIFSSCSTQKYFADNGRKISKHQYNKVNRWKYEYVQNNMTDDDKKILNSLKIDKRIKDSIINTYKNY